MGFAGVFANDRRNQARKLAGPNPKRALRLTAIPTTFDRSVLFLVLTTASMTGCHDKAVRDPTGTTGVPPSSWTVTTTGQSLLPVPSEGVLIAERETRVGDFRRFVDDTGYDAGGRWRTPVHRQAGKTHTYEQTDDHPVTLVSWPDAQAYCEWLTTRERNLGLIGSEDAYRLPTDSEWSLAAELQEPALAPEELDGKIAAKVHGNFGRHPIPVGGHRNRLGFYDLAGNVSEWVLDPYGVTREMRRHGPYDAANYKCLRGGSWFRPSNSLSDRQAALPSARSFGHGFRIALQRQVRVADR